MEIPFTCSCTNGGDNLCPVVQMEKIKPDGGQLAGRQNVCCSLVVASWLAANLSVIHFVISAEATRGFEASRLQEHDFMQLESLWPWVYNMGGI